jgi:hypothetical protein
MAKSKDIKNQLFYKTNQYGAQFLYYDKGFPENYIEIYDSSNRHGAQIVVNDQDLYDCFADKGIKLEDGKVYDLPEEIDMFESYPTYQIYSKLKKEFRKPPAKQLQELPEFDGSYLCLIKDPQQCGNTWYYFEVVRMHMAKWMVQENQTVIYWQPLPNTEEVLKHLGHL